MDDEPPARRDAPPQPAEHRDCVVDGQQQQARVDDGERGAGGGFVDGPD
jgi:hypothetical protein